MAALQSEVFMRRDLAAIMAALAHTATVTQEPCGPHAAAFRRGFRAALEAVALAVHIPPAEVLGDGRVLVFSVAEDALSAPGWPELPAHGEGRR